MSRPPDLGHGPRPLPDGLVPTGMDAWDTVYGGLLPDELVVLASDDLALGRGLALTWLDGLLRAAQPRRRRACWYRAGPVGTWDPGEHGRQVRQHVGEHGELLDLPTVAQQPGSRLESVAQVAGRVRSWADGWQDGPPVVGIVVDALPALARSRDRGRDLRLLARRLQCPVVVLDLLPTRSGRPVSALADDADHLLIVTPLHIEVRTTRRGLAGVIPWSLRRLP